MPSRADVRAPAHPLLRVPQGMVLCASDAAKTSLAFVDPPAGAAAGERVRWAGYDGEAEAPKKMAKKKVRGHPSMTLDAAVGSGVC